MSKKKTGEAIEPRLTPASDESPTAQPKVEDYLRQYQYRKQTVPGSKESDPEPGSKAEKMKEKLLAQPRVRILVPRTNGESKSVLNTVNLNGYRLDFPKNTYVDVPQQVADVIINSQQQTEEAIGRFQITGDKSKEDALT